MIVPAPGAYEPILGRAVRRTWQARRIEPGPRHRHVGFELTWVESGSIQLDIGPDAPPIEADAGACIVVPPHLEVTPRTRAAVLHQISIPPALVTSAAAALGRAAPADAKPRVLGVGDRLARLICVFLEEAASGLPAGDPGVSSLCRAVAFGLARAVAPEGARAVVSDARVRRALALVASDYRERLSVDDLAAAARMGRFSFLRAFRAHVGVSPYHYLTGFRLDRAAELLRASDRASVLDVALECGFTDPGRFARAFRERHGCSPRAYRDRGHEE